jgi:hypothetical protein
LPVTFQGQGKPCMQFELNDTALALGLLPKNSFVSQKASLA